MSVFEFTARDMEGNKISGRLESASRSAALSELAGRKIIPLSVKKSKSLAEFLPARHARIKSEELIIFTRQLMTMQRAGIGLLSCLHSLRTQTENPVMKKVIDEIYRDVSDGSSLSDAMGKHSSIFNNVYISTIRVGEEGGVLDNVLQRLVGLLEHESETKAALKQAVRYPLIVLVGLMVSFAVAVLFVLPKFSELYRRYDAELPLPTRMLIGLNDVIHHQWPAVAGVLAIAVVSVTMVARTERGKNLWDEYKLTLPILGPLFLRISVTRFARMFATLEKCGLPLLKNLEIVAESVGNLVIARQIIKQKESVQQGKSIADSLKNNRYFPPLVVEMLSIGEASGAMEEVLTAVSDHYDREIDYTIKNMTTLIEPLITLIMGGFVLFMAIAVFLPMWKLSSVVRR